MMVVDDDMIMTSRRRILIMIIIMKMASPANRAPTDISQEIQVNTDTTETYSQLSFQTQRSQNNPTAAYETTTSPSAASLTTPSFPLHSSAVTISVTFATIKLLC